MTNILYVIAIILVVLWGVGFFAFNAGPAIHMLLVISIIAILLRVTQGEHKP